MRNRVVAIANSLFGVGRWECLESGMVFCFKIKQFVCVFGMYGTCSSLIRRRLPIGDPSFDVCRILNRCLSESFVVWAFFGCGF